MTLRELASNGDIGAQYQLGGCFKYGLCGYRQNFAEAMKWYTCAAEQGHVSAMHNLAVCYEEGQGAIQANKLEAKKWYKRAAEAGSAESQHNLGLIYLNGNNLIPQDIQKAVKWFEKAAEQGIPESQYNCGSLYYEGRGNLAANEEKGLKWLLCAKAEGYAMAIEFLRKINVAALEEDTVSEAQNLARQQTQLSEKKDRLRIATFLALPVHLGSPLFGTPLEWKDYPNESLTGKYKGHAVQYLTMEPEDEAHATNLCQALEKGGFFTRLRRTKNNNKPSLVVDLTESKPKNLGK